MVWRMTWESQMQVGTKCGASFPSSENCSWGCCIKQQNSRDLDKTEYHLFQPPEKMLRNSSRFLGPAQQALRTFATMPHTPVGIIKPSPEEIKTLRLNARNLEKAVRHIHQDGLVVIEDVVPHDHLDHLNKKMVEDAQILLARGDDGPFNYNKGNIQQDPPPVSEFFFSSVFTSKSPHGTRRSSPRLTYPKIPSRHK